MNRETLVQGILTLLADVSDDQVPAVLAEVKSCRGTSVPSEQSKPSVQVVKKSCLKFVGTSTVPALTERFLVSDRFKKNKDPSAGPLISGVGGVFLSRFGDMVVESHTGSTLNYHVLTRRASDTDIIDVLGGEDKVETLLAEVWSQMTQQGRGQSGSLLNDGKANIFYVRDSDRVLRALGVVWFDYGWDFRAREVGLSFWSEYGRVFSRNSMQP
ncbi:MAG: hypothetical protein UT32_C0026G0005 [Parcubacteria group bacterium GW2011_GWC2_39_14]|nr:MAG: hypothetical protein UT32_C0026G0005 [Parcubacteria group bacterium GW2011_GWC2_39_14]KKR53427.1 MAG: hypothetical protein UT91_C0027G0005 [Parcubacteria group bacterium GW2011_GWA2_40_23]